MPQYIQFDKLPSAAVTLLPRFIDLNYTHVFHFIIKQYMLTITKELTQINDCPHM